MAEQRYSDLGLLRPSTRAKVERVVTRLVTEQLPLRPFETARSPRRQRELYARGRDSKKADFGRTVTRAGAYQSAHQFGDGVDFVGWVNSAWTWDLPARIWKRYGEIAAAEGLVQLSFEQPHVQPAGWDWRSLTAGPQNTTDWLDWLSKLA